MKFILINYKTNINKNCDLFWRYDFLPLLQIKNINSKIIYYGKSKRNEIAHFSRRRKY